MAFSIKMAEKEQALPNSYSKLKTFIWNLMNALMAVFFYTSAVLQINDPDSGIWIILYLVPGVICCAIITFPKIQDFWLFKSLTLIPLIISLAGILYTSYIGSAEIGKHNRNIFETEEGRELGGLTIITAWLCITLFINSKSIQTMTFSGWLKIVSVALFPVALTALWFYTVDIKMSPDHCKGILNKVI